MEHELLPHAEIPEKHDEEHRHLGEERVPAKEAHSYPEEEFRPEKPAHRNAKYHGILLPARMLTLKYPAETEHMIPCEPEHVRNECVEEIELRTESIEQGSVDCEVNDRRRRTHEEIAEELYARVVGTAKDPVLHG